MEVVNKKLVLVVIMLGIVCTFFIWQNISDNKTKLEIVSLNKEIKTSSMFAIMLEQIDEEGNSTYVESEDNTWPTDDTYVYDITKSGCMDINGNKIENALEYDLVNKIASVKTEKPSYCYLYFSKPINLYELCEGTENMSDCLIQREEQIYMVNNVTDEITGGMYRYQGTYEVVQDNYICFGVSTIEDCIGSEYKDGIYDENKISKYMYRIIGITPDGNLKLIKKEPLEGTYRWYKNDYRTDIIWPDSDLYKGINGIEGGAYTNLFVNNENYEYVNELNKWYLKIEDYNWKYGDLPSFNHLNAINVYNLEYSFNDVVKSKISLIYLHDYYLSYIKDINCFNNSTCLNSWLHIYNNSGLEINETTMTRWGLYSNGDYTVWMIRAEGDVWYGYQNSIRPTFYSVSDIQIISGDGTATNPYIIA